MSYDIIKYDMTSRHLIESILVWIYDIYIWYTVYDNLQQISCMEGLLARLTCKMLARHGDMVQRLVAKCENLTRGRVPHPHHDLRRAQAKGGLEVYYFTSL